MFPLLASTSPDVPETAGRPVDSSDTEQWSKMAFDRVPGAIHAPTGTGKGPDDVELATLEWVDWHNRRLA